MEELEVLPLVLLLIGFMLAGVALAALSLSLNEFQKKVDAFCAEVDNRYRPGVYTEMEEEALKKIEALTQGNNP